MTRQAWVSVIKCLTRLMSKNTKNAVKLGLKMWLCRALVAVNFTVVILLTACGGGSSSGGSGSDATRTVFTAGDVFETVEDGGSLFDDVSKNDIGSDLEFALASDTSMANGVLEFNPDGTFTYTPNADFYGTDSVSYVATDPISGESDTATLTIQVINDFERLEEYGWQLVWSDEFNAESLNETLWTGINASVSGGNLVLSAPPGESASIQSVENLTYGRLEARVKAAGSDHVSAFKLAPAMDAYAGQNVLSLLETRAGLAMAGAHYGLGLTGGVRMSAELVETLVTEFHSYAVEWGADEIRWYIDGDHVHTLDTLHTWGYALDGTDVLVDNEGPFNQAMQVLLSVAAPAGVESATLMVDQLKVWACDPSVESRVDACASGEKTRISKLASNRIESVGDVFTDLYVGGYYDLATGAKLADLQPLTWHYDNADPQQLTLTPSIALDVDTVTLEGARGMVLDVNNTLGTATLDISTDSSELIGKDLALVFDLYIDSANTAATAFSVGMRSNSTHGAQVELELAGMVRDTWATYRISTDQLLANPISINGEPAPLDLRQVTSLMTLEIEGSAHMQLDNIRLSCINSEGCVQFPLRLQASVPKADPIRYEAENFIDSQGAGVQDTSDEGGGQNVAFVSAGDYLVYSIEAPGIGPYSIDYRVASAGGSDGFTVSIDGEEVDRQTVPDTGDWQNWTNLTSAEFELALGVYTLKIEFIDGDQNINWFELQPPITQICVEAEDFDDQSGISLEDTLDTEPCIAGGAGGGENIGYIDVGDFVEYSISVPSDGNYLIEYRIASEQDSEFELSVGGVMLDARSFEGSGGWQEWTSRSAVIPLTAGEQMMRLDFVGGSVSGAININWIRLTRQ